MHAGADRDPNVRYTEATYWEPMNGIDVWVGEFRKYINLKNITNIISDKDKTTFWHGEDELVRVEIGSPISLGDPESRIRLIRVTSQEYHRVQDTLKDLDRFFTNWTLKTLKRIRQGGTKQ